MLPMQVALVPYEDVPVERSRLLRVAAALQTQVERDLGPIWDVRAVVAPFLELEDVPPGYWPLVLVHKLAVQLRGLHNASGGRPFALVSVEDGDDHQWSRLASHELIELLCDPWGARTFPGRSIHDLHHPDEPQQGQVEYLVETCDPCQKQTYVVDGVLVSDFVTPSFYDTTGTGGGRYSFTGAVTAPRTVLDGGYITWRVPTTNEIWQAFGTSDGISYQQLGGNAIPSAVSLRQWIDGYPEHRAPPRPLPAGDPALAAAEAARELADASSTAYGQALKRDVDQIVAQLSKPQLSVQLSSGEYAKVLELIADLGVAGSPARTSMETDPAAELARRGIAVQGVLPATPEKLATPEHYQEVAAKLEAGHSYTDLLTSQEGFGGGLAVLGSFWWLGVLGGS
jgi:hypothetical protein